MFISHSKKFIMGFFMCIIFFAVLGLMFSPIFDDKNAFEASDMLFNSIAKGSTYYIPQLKAKNESLKSTDIEITIQVKDQAKSQKLLAQFATINAREGKLLIKGDLHSILAGAIKDADALYHNKDEELTTRYGFSSKQVGYVWWQILTAMVTQLKQQKQFKEAAIAQEIIYKGVEVGYNFLGVKPESVNSRIGILIFSLVFYVIYTMWWGYAIFFMMEGVGLVVSAGSKQEA